MAKIVKRGAATNPMVVVTEDEVLGFLAAKLTSWVWRAPVARGSSRIRNLPDGQDDVLLMAVPELVLMVSNRADPLARLPVQSSI